MSGGSMDYVCWKISDASKYVKDKEIKDLMEDLANLMHDLEWYESGDYNRATYETSLAEFKAKWFKGKRNDRLKKYINESMDDLKKELYSMIGEEL